MEILAPSQILNAAHYAIVESVKPFIRDGIALEKGAVITAKRIDRNLDLYEKYCWYFSTYPEQFLKLITPTNSKFSLKFFQVIFLRACLRYGRILTIAPRAAGKSFICILALYLICIFRPHSHVFQCANMETPLFCKK